MKNRTHIEQALTKLTQSLPPGEAKILLGDALHDTCALQSDCQFHENIVPTLQRAHIITTDKTTRSAIRAVLTSVTQYMRGNEQGEQTKGE
ncbi:MAG: hypothetical protein WCX29_02105 [Candidatus Peribacteraceae bacterium]